MHSSADTARIRAASAFSLALLAGACAGADKPKSAAVTQARSYAIGPVGPGLARGDPGKLTRWQNQMAADMRGGRPAASRGAPTTVRRSTDGSGSRSSLPMQSAAAPAGPQSLASSLATGAPAAAQAAGPRVPAGAVAAASAATPVLSRATLNAPGIRPAAAASNAVRGAIDVRWLWAVVAASLAALTYVLGRAVVARRERSRETNPPLAPGPVRIERPRRPLYKPGPPPPRVTVLSSARR